MNQEALPAIPTPERVAETLARCGEQAAQRAEDRMIFSAGFSVTQAPDGVHVYYLAQSRPRNVHAVATDRHTEWRYLQLARYAEHMRDMFHCEFSLERIPHLLVSDDPEYSADRRLRADITLRLINAAHRINDPTRMLQGFFVAPGNTYRTAHVRSGIADPELSGSLMLMWKRILDPYWTVTSCADCETHETYLDVR